MHLNWTENYPAKSLSALVHQERFAADQLILIMLHKLSFTRHFSTELWLDLFFHIVQKHFDANLMLLENNSNKNRDNILFLLYFIGL